MLILQIVPRRLSDWLHVEPEKIDTRAISSWVEVLQPLRGSRLGLVLHEERTRECNSMWFGGSRSQLRPGGEDFGRLANTRGGKGLKVGFCLDHGILIQYWTFVSDGSLKVNTKSRIKY